MRRLGSGAALVGLWSARLLLILVLPSGICRAEERPQMRVPRVLVLPGPRVSKTPAEPFRGVVLLRDQLPNDARVPTSETVLWESIVGKPLPPGAPIPPGGVHLRPVRPGGHSIPLKDGALDIGVLQVIAQREQEVAVQVAVARSLPEELLLPGIKADADESIRLLVVGRPQDLPSQVTVVSESPWGQYLDSLRDLPLASAACPPHLQTEWGEGTEGWACAKTPAVRVAMDTVERNHPVLRARTLLGEVGGSLTLRVSGDESFRLPVRAPRGLEASGPGRYRVQVRARILRSFAGGPPAVGSDDEEALQIVRDEIASASRMWGQCGVHLGPPEMLDVAVVDPPKLSLLTVGCGRAVNAQGGQIAAKVGGKRLMVRTFAGQSPRAVASRLASAIRSLGFRVHLFRNASERNAAQSSFDLVISDTRGDPVSIAPLSGHSLSLDPTLDVCVGRLNLADGLVHFNDENTASGTTEERMLLRALSDQDPGTIELLVVPVFAGIGRIGESFIRSAGGSVENALILDRTGIRAGARSFTLAHELGHILLDMPGHPDDFGVDTPTSLMDADAADSTIFGPRRLTLDDCRRALRQSGRSAPTPLIVDWPISNGSEAN